jgi:RNA polymerase sigma-70 factor (ECF subfamily)
LPQTNQHIETLIPACKKGDHKAQLEIYNRYQKAMYNTAFRIVKDQFEAEDIMQDSFLTAFGKLDDLREIKMFGAWLKKIVVHASLSHYRKKQKQNEIPLEEVLFKVENEEAEEQDEEDFNHLKAKQVLDTLKELKENYRLILTLHLIDGYDYEEICRMMKISNANCRTMISRAKESLRKKLKTKMEKTNATSIPQ